jgi:hypothetical protein
MAEMKWTREPLDYRMNLTELRLQLHLIQISGNGRTIIFVMITHQCFSMRRKRSISRSL